MEFRKPKHEFSAQKKIMLFTGFPGAGKTTLMRVAASRLNISNFHCKDDFMVPLLEQHPNPTFEELVSLRKQAFDQLAQASQEVLAEYRLSFIEGNFDRKVHATWLERLRVATNAAVVQVYCNLPIAEAWRRFDARQQTDEWPAAHPRRTREEYMKLFVKGVSPILPVYKGVTIEVDMMCEEPDIRQIIGLTRATF